MIFKVLNGHMWHFYFFQNTFPHIKRIDKERGIYGHLGGSVGKPLPSFFFFF